MSFPTWANRGPANGGTNNVTVSWPVNYANNDIALLVCQSDNQAITETSGGWTQIGSQQGVGAAAAPGSTRIAVFWKRVTNAGAEAPAVLADSGDHTNGIIVIIRGCPKTGDPVNAVIGGTEATVDTSLDASGLVTTVPECLVIIAACHGIDTLTPEWSGEVAPNLGSLTERYDASITIGNGGGTAIWSGTLPLAGNAGAFSAVGVTPTAKAWMMIALSPKPKVLNTTPIPGATGPWLQTNPGAGGTWGCVGAGPTGIIAAGGDVSGLYISKDRGASWSSRGNKAGLNQQFISSIAFDPIDALLMYVGTSHGVYRSIDSGDTWGLTGPDLWIADVGVAKSNPNVVYAAYHTTFDSLFTGILKSTDHGVTFTILTTNLPTNLHVNRMMVDTTNPNILYLVSADHDFNHTPDASIWRSADGGVTWTRISSALQAAGVVWDCVMDRLVPTTLWATIYTGDPFHTPFVWAGSTWVSTNSGTSWTQKNSHTGNVMVKYDDSNTIWVVDNKRTEGATEEGFWESTNGGGSWAKKSTLGDYDTGWQPTADLAYGAGNYGISHGFGQDLSDPNSIYQISSQFLHGSFNAGLIFYNLYTYQVSSNYWTTRRLENLTVADIYISEALKGLVYMGAYDIGMWRSFDYGGSWQTANSPDFTGDWFGNGGNTTTIMLDPALNNVVWAAQGRTENTSTLVKNTNFGEAGSWVAANGGLPASSFLYGLSLDRNSPIGNRTMFITSGQDGTKSGDVYRSTDDGANWTLVLQPTVNLAARVTAIDAMNPLLVYAGGEGGLWRSTTGGGVGSFVALTVPADFVGSASGFSIGSLKWTGVAWIATDPKIANRLYVATYSDTGGNRGLYRSDDAGNTWTKMFTGDYVRRCAVSRYNSNHIFVCSAKTITSASNGANLSLGIWRSKDAGVTWENVNDNLPWTMVGPISISPGKPYTVFAGSTGNGFFKREFESVVQMSAMGR